MTFKELQAEMMTAMKEKNQIKKTILSEIVACAKNMAIEEGCKENITDEIVTKAILKSKKICQEQIDTCPKDRPTLLGGFKACMECIDEYAPKMMSIKELEIKIPQILDSIDDSWRTWNKGQIMKTIVPILKGKAEGKDINKVVELILKGLGR